MSVAASATADREAAALRAFGRAVLGKSCTVYLPRKCLPTYGAGVNDE
jgi:hypothetical protein